MTVRLSWMIAIAALVCAVLLPGRYYYGFRSAVSGQEFGYPRRIIEGRTGVLAIFPDGSFELNGAKYTAGAATGGFAEIGYAPAVMVGRPLERALVIGAGQGDVIIALANLPGSPTIDVAELSEEVVAAQRDATIAWPGSGQYFRMAQNVEIHVVDGRRWVSEALARGLRYDLIQLGINSPSTGTSGNLYTREMFKKMHDLLAPDGVLMVYSFGGALRTGLDVFAHAYFLSGIPKLHPFNGEVFMTKRPLEAPVWQDNELREVVERCNSRARRVEPRDGCATASSANASLTLREVPRSLLAQFPLNVDDTVVMTFDKLWRQNHPRPGLRLWLGSDIDPAALPATPVRRVN